MKQLLRSNFPWVPAIIFICLPGLLSAQHKSKLSVTGLQKIETNDTYTPILINNLFNYYSNSGDGAFNPYSAYSEGLDFPKGTGRTLVFEEGVVWGGKHNGTIKVDGSTYWHGLQAGRIVTPGTSPIADDPSATTNHVYRVRSDINPSTPFDSAKIASSEKVLMQYQGLTAQQIYNQYISDWNNWPAASGAPYADLNNNGVYDPSVDIPGYPGADQTLWYVANDLDPSRVSSFVVGSAPIGLEMQRTIWSYNKYGALDNTIFARTRLINKSGYPVDSMYVGQWSDPDLGGATDDNFACDTVRNLGYAYNGTNNDAVYGSAPPAVGYGFVIGPNVRGVSSDMGYRNGILQSGYKNIGVTSFVPFINGSSIYGDPSHGSFTDVSQWYNSLKGFTTNGSPFTITGTGTITKYVASGDPVGNTGWLYSSIAPPSDVRFLMSSGPFSLAVGDTQEIVVATMVGQGLDRLSSVSQLKLTDDHVQAFTNGHADVGIAPVASLVLTNTVVPLNGSITIPGSSATVAGQWSLVTKPNGSSASIQIVGTGKATITPDLPGYYTITYETSAYGGGSEITSFLATSNEPPVPIIQAPAQVTIGDSIRFDGLSSTDAEVTDTLHYSWLVSGGDVSDRVSHYDSIQTTVTGSTSNKGASLALRASTITISLDLNDGTWTANTTKAVTVNPLKTPNTLINSTISSSLFPSGGFYGFGPFRLDNNGVLWTNIDGVYSPLNFLDPIHPVQSYNLFIFGNFTVNNGNIYVAQAARGVSINQTNGSGNITGYTTINPGPTHSNKDTTVVEVFVTGQNLIFSDGVLGLYVYNVSNPLAPTYSTQFTNGQYWGNFIVSGTTLVGVHSRTSTMTVLDISNSASPSQLAFNTLPHAYTNVRKYGSYYYFFKSDTIGIYDLTNVSAPVLKSEIAVPKTLNTANTISDISGDGTTLMIATTEGVYFYNVANSAAPILNGNFLTGTRYTQAYIGGGNVFAFNAGRGIAGGYEGLNSFNGVLTDVAEQSSGAEQPRELTLYQNYPNPFNPSTSISFTLPSHALVTLKVYDLLGREVATLVNEELSAGTHNRIWDASQIASGIYFYRLRAGDAIKTQKLVLLK